MILNKYQEMMNYIKLTDDVKAVMLKNIKIGAGTHKNKNIHHPIFKMTTTSKVILITAACVMIIVGGLGVNLAKSSEVGPIIEDPMVQQGTPFTEVDSLEELEDRLGFEMEELDLPSPPTSTVYTVYNQMGEITYLLEDENKITYRKSLGPEDNSGDYNMYDTVEPVTINNITFTLKAFGEDYYLATWSQDGYSYSISFITPVSRDELVNILNHFQ